ncbi:ABC transporter, partial [Streptomyces sp. 2MCAF27]
MRTRALAVETNQLVKTYPGGVKALDGMELAVESGIVFGLL